MQLLHLRANLRLRRRPVFRLRQAQAAVRQVTGRAGALVGRGGQLAVGVLELAGCAAVGVVEDVDG